MMLLLLQTALAWTYSNQPFDYIMETNCAGFAPVPAGSSWTYRMWAPSADPMDDFIDDIVNGAEVWDAGPGTINRGADWAWVRGSDHNNTLSLTDSQNEVLHLTHAELQAHLGGIPVPSFAAITMRAMLAPQCFTLIAVDIAFNEDVDWEEVLPSAMHPVTEASPEAVAVHEFGHALGLGHVANAAVMRNFRMAEQGFDISLGEDDYVGLKAIKPMPASNGKNFSLSKWRKVPPAADRKVVEEWTSALALQWDAGVCGTVAATGGPAKLYATVKGTASSYTVPIEWTLSSDLICFDDDDITIGTRFPTLSANQPYLINPSNDEYIIPTSTPDGDYYVCAGINPDQTESEAEGWFWDNTIRSEGKWSIDCP